MIDEDLRRVPVSPLVVWNLGTLCQALAAGCYRLLKPFVDNNASNIRCHLLAMLLCDDVCR